MPPVAEYYVQVDRNSDFSSPEYNSGWITGTWWDTYVNNTSDFYDGYYGYTDYYWRVGARDPLNPGTVSWSASWSFRAEYGCD